MPSSPAPNDSSHPGHRLWMPAGIVFLVVAAMGIVELNGDLERNLKGWLQWAFVPIGAALLLLWFTFFSRIRWRLRLLGLALVIGAAFALPRFVRVDGTVDGRGLPRFALDLPGRPPATVPTAPSTPPVLTTLSPAPDSPRSSPALADSPQFLGPHRDGTLQNIRLARDWTSHPPRELWRIPVGAGWSAFAVVAGRAFTQEQRGTNECLTAYEALTGRLLWSHANPVHFTEWQGGEGPRATPTFHENRLYAYGATGILDCLDPATGTRLWSRDVFQEYHLHPLTWGASASPLVFSNTVVVSGGQKAGPTLLAFDRTNGTPRWQAGTDKAAYASPILATLAGHTVILSFNATHLTAHDPATGTERLRLPWGNPKWPKAAQPVVVGDRRIFLSAGYGMGCELFEIRTLPDGTLDATSVWKNHRMKAQFNSVAAREGFLYGLDDGLLACVDLATGERRWKDGRFGSGQSLLVDDLVLVQAESGEVALAAARPEAYQELGRLPALRGKTWNYPTLAGRILLVRNDHEAAAYELAAAE